MSENKKTYFRMFKNQEGYISTTINKYTASTLRKLADEAELAFKEASEGTVEGDKVRAGFISLFEMHPDKIREWDLPEGTVQLAVSKPKTSSGGL